MAEFEEKMQKAVDNLATDYASIRAGRANPHLLDKIKVEYYNTNFEKRIKTFKDFTAQIIQHEIDHLHGIII